MQITSRGYTVLEAIVYISLLTIVASGSIATIFLFDDIMTRNRIERALGSSAEIALEAIARDTRDAFAVNTLNSTLDVSPGVLEIQADALVTKFYVLNGQIQISRDGVLVGPLTSSGVTVDSLIFRHYINAETEAVRVELELSAVDRDISISRTYYTTTVLRRSYD